MKLNDCYRTKVDSEAFAILILPARLHASVVYLIL